MNKRSSSLKKLYFKTWVYPGIFALVAAFSAFLAIGGIDYRNTLQRSIDDLEKKNNVAARRIEAELWLGTDGSVKPIATHLAKELGLREIGVTKNPPKCFKSTSSIEQSCWSKENSLIHSYERLPVNGETFYVKGTVDAPSYIDSLNLVPLIWAILSIALILSLGLILQNRMLRKYIMQPIESLVDVSNSDETPPQSWPKEIRQISQKLRESLEDRDQAIIGRLTSGIMHDIKNPLQSLVAASHLASEKKKNDPKRISRLEHLNDVCREKLTVVGKIIETTLDGNRDIHIEKNSENLRRTVENSIQLNQEQLEKRRIELSISGNNSLPHDPVQLGRVLSNLIRNSIEAFDEETYPNKISVSISQRDDLSQISIEDSGPGLKSNPENIFKAFRSTKVRGTGLGLLISKKIVEAHGGSITASKSESLGGARFDLSFPGTTHGVEL